MSIVRKATIFWRDMMIYAVAYTNSHAIMNARWADATGAGGEGRPGCLDARNHEAS